MVPATTGTERNAALDGLRAFAILPVIAAHAHLPGFAGGGVGVDVFFGLSGFLITSLLLAECAANDRIDLRNFWLRRALRLLPALLVLVLAVDLLALVVANPYLDRSLAATPAVLLYVGNWLIVAQQAPALGWFGPLWSLSVEEQFYLLWPLLLVLALRTRHRLRAVGLIAATGILASGLLRALTFDGTDLYRTFGTDHRVDQLLIGALLAVVVRAGGTPFVRRWSGRLALPALAYLVVVWVVVPDFNASGAETANRLYYTAGLPVVGLCTAVLIGALTTRPDSRLATVFATRPLVWTGRISYGMYLWHYPVIMVMARLVSPAPPVLFLTSLAVTYGVATLSWRWLERPLHRRFHARLRARTGASDLGRKPPQAVRTRRSA